GTPGKLLGPLFKGVIHTLTGSGYTQAEYRELFQLLYETFSVMRKNGDMAVEKDVDDPKSSPIFSKYAGFLHNHTACNMLCDTLRLIVSGSANPQEIAPLLDEDMATFEEEHHRLVALVAKAGDALPALGIVAAVLGIIIAMGALDAGPSVLGHKIGAALVGTFLGVFMSYGLIQPIATKMEMMGQDEKKYLECIKIAILAYLHGAAPIIAVEHARRITFSGERPSAAELEQACKGGTQAAA
ncbi:MAG: flagellar motor stator protein MotA, partial [Deltaproteobacteria bacterium]|nr:flagellar motor stator protein MotA [Deltaproteobacteria bacterium]